MLNKKKLSERKLIFRAIYHEEQREEVLEIDINLFSGERKEIFLKLLKVTANGEELDYSKLPDNEMEEMRAILSCNVIKKNLKSDIETLVEVTSKSRFRDAYQKALISEDDFDTMKEKFVQEINGIDAKKNDEVTDLKSLAIGLFEEIDNKDAPGTAIKIGWDNVDKRCTFDEGDLIIIAARPAMGKSAYSLCMAMKLCAQGKRGLFFSLEMGKNKVMKRIISCMSGVHMTKIKDKYGQQYLTDLEMGALAKGVSLIDGYKFDICDIPALSIQQVRAEAKRYNRQNRLDFIIVDYLQLIHAQADSKTNEIAAVSLGLKELARELEIPIIALAQLNRGVEQRVDKRPMMSDLRESGQIEQDASIIQMLYRDDYYNEESEFPGVCEVITVKNREDECGTDYFRFQGEVQRFLEFSGKV